MNNVKLFQEIECQYVFDAHLYAIYVFDAHLYAMYVVDVHLYVTYFVDAHLYAILTLVDAHLCTCHYRRFHIRYLQNGSVDFLHWTAYGATDLNSKANYRTTLTYSEIDDILHNK